MSATQIDTLMLREQKDYDFDFSLKASIVAGETLDSGTPVVVDIFVDRGPGVTAALSYSGTAFDVPNNRVQVQDLTPAAAAAGSTYVVKVTAATNEGNLLSVAGALEVKQYV